MYRDRGTMFMHDLLYLILLILFLVWSAADVPSAGKRMGGQWTH